VADLTALAAKLNEDAVTRLTELVKKLVSDIDAAAQLTDAIEAVAESALQRDLEATPMGDHTLSSYDKLSVASSFSSGHSVAALSGILAGALIAPPFSLILGVGLGGAFAFTSFLSRDQQHFVAAFTSWMTAQVSQAQLTINSTFARQMIDLQAQLREGIQQALAQREQEISTALRNAETMLQAETAKRNEASTAMRQRLEAVVATRADTAKLLASLATGDVAPAAEAPPAADAAPAADGDAAPGAAGEAAGPGVPAGSTP
jgi:hypothetical protein